MLTGSPEPAPRRGGRQGLTADEWWRDGWLVDAHGTAEWDEVARPGREAAALAEAFGGRVVRLRRLPDGYAAIDRDEDGLAVPLDIAHFGILTIVTYGWEAGPAPPDGAALLGPVAFVAAARRRARGGAAADAGPGDSVAPGPAWLRLGAWTLALSLGVAFWATVIAVVGGRLT